MSKGTLVIDMPECCKTCDLCVLEDNYISLEYVCRGAKEFNGYVKTYKQINRHLLNQKPDWCPIKEILEKTQDNGGKE